MGFWEDFLGGAVGGAIDSGVDWAFGDSSSSNVGPIADGDIYGDYLDTGNTSGFDNYWDSYNYSSGKDDSIWDDGNLWSGVFSTAANAGIGLLQANQKKDEREAALELQAAQAKEAREARAFELRLAALKELYGRKGGGGGGGGGGGLTKAQQLAAINQQGQLKQRAISDAATALSNAYGLGGARQ